MTRVAHLSDTHFGTETPEVMHAVEQAVHHLQPDIITITGDITQRAHIAQFAAAKSFLDRMPATLKPATLKFVIPGNHDIPLINMPLRLLNPYRHYRSIFPAREGVWNQGDIGIIGFDATSRWRHTRGKLLHRHVRKQLQEMRRHLRPDAIIIACAHQPLIVGLPEDEENVLVHAEETAKIFSEHGVDVVLSGHVHWPLITTTETTFPKLKRHFILSGAGTAISARTRPGAPNSFNLIQVNSSHHMQTITISLMEYASEKKCFEAATEVIFTRSEAGWHVAETKTIKANNPQLIPNYGASRY